MKNVLPDALVGAIYDAAMRPETWPHVLERIGAQLGARAGVLMVQDRSASAARIGYSSHYGFPDGALAAYTDYYIGLDTRPACRQCCRGCRRA